jgi:hypothetical protein
VKRPPSIFCAIFGIAIFFLGMIDGNYRELTIVQALNLGLAAPPAFMKHVVARRRKAIAAYHARLESRHALATLTARKHAAIHAIATSQETELASRNAAPSRCAVANGSFQMASHTVTMEAPAPANQQLPRSFGNAAGGPPSGEDRQVFSRQVATALLAGAEGRQAYSRRNQCEH